MITIEMIIAEPTQYIELSGNGAIRHHSRLIKEFDGNLDLLLACIENNIYEKDDNDEVTEYIDYARAIADYKKN